MKMGKSCKRVQIHHIIVAKPTGSSSNRVFMVKDTVGFFAVLAYLLFVTAITLGSVNFFHFDQTVFFISVVSYFVSVYSYRKSQNTAYELNLLSKPSSKRGIYYIYFFLLYILLLYIFSKEFAQKVLTFT